MRLLVLFSLCAFALLAESAGGLRWTAPAGWKSEGSAPMRAATYRLPPVQPDSDGAECVVYFFGVGQGGGVQDNLDRWTGQFQRPDGGDAEAKVAKRTVRGLPVTTIELSGVYSGMGGPNAAARTLKRGYRMLGAIIENPGGNVFLKFTGPEKTIDANRARFEQVLESFEKE